LVTSVRGIALEPMTAASVALGFIGFMNAAFGLRFLPAAFFAFFFAILASPLNDRFVALTAFYPGFSPLTVER
jgi:hypothetical protein